MKNEIPITIFTPTYNRAYILGKLYKSLREQRIKTFEWLIIDDGSSDNTETLVKNWIEEQNDFDIVYLKVKNGGKHRAINKGVNMARGKMFFIVDSDDYLTEDAIEKILNYEKDIPHNSEAKYAGIAFARGYDKNTIIGTTFSEKYLDATSLERKKYNINGDKAEIFYTEILKKYKFPEFDGEKFLSEATIWYRIADQGYKLRWFQDIIYICKYRDDGLTKNAMINYLKNPKGNMAFAQTILEVKETTVLQKIKQAIHYVGNALIVKEDKIKKGKRKNLYYSVLSTRNCIWNNNK